MKSPIVFASDVSPDFGQPWPDEFTWDKGVISGIDEEKIAQASNERVEHLYALYKQQPELEDQNPIQWGWTLPMWRRVMELWSKCEIIIILGGNRCIAGDSLIYNPLTRRETRVDEIKGLHHVRAWDEKKKSLVPAIAEDPFVKGYDEILNIELSNGEHIRVSRNHQVLSEYGYVSCGSLNVGDVLFHPETTSGTSLPVPLLNDRHSWSKEQDSRDDYHPLSYSYDEQLPVGLDIFPNGVPLQDDVRKHVFSWYEDDLACRRKYNPYYSLSFLPSNQDARLPILGQFSDTLFHDAYTPCRSILEIPQVAPRSMPESGPRRSIDESFQRASRFSNESYFSCLKVISITPESQELIYDFNVPEYHNYWMSGAIHHNSTKSTLMARLCVWAAMTIPEAEIRCWHVDSKRSIEDQHEFIHEALPREYKKLADKPSRDYSFGWSQKTGFSGDIVIFPKQDGYKKGSYIKFNHYTQWHKDQQKIEGSSSHLIWADEECPQKLFATLPARLNKFNGKLMLTFTTLQGWTSLISDLLHKATVDKKRYSPIAKHEVHYEQTSRNWDSCKILYFWSQDNPFEPYETLRKRYAGRSIAEQMA